MAYDEELAERIREVVEGEPGLTEKAMFGGLAFLVGGHMAVSASGQGGMLLRCDPAQTDDLVTHPHVQRFEMRGREMDGWLGWTRRRSRPRTTCATGWAAASPTPGRCRPSRTS
jgi:hypothetical protein